MIKFAKDIVMEIKERGKIVVPKNYIVGENFEKYLRRKVKNCMYKQIIIARRDLNMSAGKLAAQVSHGSMAFLTWKIRNNNSKWISNDGSIYYSSELTFEKDLYEQWIDGEFTKCVLQAKNRNQLLKAKTMAEELDMKEGKDFWLIYDSCRTELEPEENGRTLTVIGFRPMSSEIIDKIAKKYHLYM